MLKYLECHDVYNLFSNDSGEKVCYIEKREKTNVAKNEYMEEVHRCS